MFGSLISAVVCCGWSHAIKPGTLGAPPGASRRGQGSLDATGYLPGEKLPKFLKSLPIKFGGTGLMISALSAPAGSLKGLAIAKQEEGMQSYWSPGAEKPMMPKQQGTSGRAEPCWN